MKIIIDQIAYEHLKVLELQEVKKLIQRFGKPNKRGYDGLLGDFFSSRHIGYYGFVAKHDRRDGEARDVYLCQHKGDYWISLNYGHDNHLDVPDFIKKYTTNK